MKAGVRGLHMLAAAALAHARACRGWWQQPPEPARADSMQQPSLVTGSPVNAESSVTDIINLMPTQ